jgi:hypothetical protein
MVAYINRSPSRIPRIRDITTEILHHENYHVLQNVMAQLFSDCSFCCFANECYSIFFEEENRNEKNEMISKHVSATNDSQFLCGIATFDSVFNRTNEAIVKLQKNNLKVSEIPTIINAIRNELKEVMNNKVSFQTFKKIIPTSIIGHDEKNFVENSTIKPIDSINMKINKRFQEDISHAIIHYLILRD